MSMSRKYPPEMRDRSGLSTEERARIRQLEKENAELRRANAILRTASAFFAAELDRPQPR
jgi:transposase